MKFSVVVLGAPYSTQSSQSALAFAQAVLDEGHELYRVFFHQDGVLNANRQASPPQGETNLVAAWSDFGLKHGVELVTCVASSLGRGILDDAEAARLAAESSTDAKSHASTNSSHSPNTNSSNHANSYFSNLAPGFIISGLGQLIDACMESDRVMTFG